MTSSQFKLSTIPRLLRAQQWYKNTIIFLAIFFSGNILSIPNLKLVALGFISLSLAASTGYIINDLRDKEQDKLHPEKKKRPIANEEVTPLAAIITAIITLICSLTLAYFLAPMFLFAVLAYLCLTLTYSFILKHIFIIDILTIATLFIIRALSGALIINVFISPWLVLCPFFLALVLVAAKRYGDLTLLKTKRQQTQTRKTLKHYSIHNTKQFMKLASILFILAYSIYSLTTTIQSKVLAITIPFAMITTSRYYYLATNKQSKVQDIARKPHYLFKDELLLSTTIIWVITVALILYI